jgi:glutamyl-tRNA synthetase
VRVEVDSEVVRYVDGAAGEISQDLGRDVGDFVLRRGDGVFAYQLAVAVDDVEMGVTDVVRGADLVASTPRQIWLMGALGAAAPRYTHVPLVLAPDGARLEKRTHGVAVRELRGMGVAPERIIGRLAFGLGLAPSDAPRSAAEVAEGSRRRTLAFATASWPAPTDW